LFSTSLKGLSLEKENFTEIADFKIKEIVDGKKYERCFTDGIGIISRSLAKRLAKEIKRYDENVYPSAFQIRCGGYKGNFCLLKILKIRSYKSNQIMNRYGLFGYIQSNKRSEYRCLLS